MSDKPGKPKIKAENILVAEFEYIAGTAFQANEDRARVSTFYLVSVGSLFGAFFGTQGETSPSAYTAFAGLFLFLSVFGALTLLQLIRLRQAWFQSAKAMNKMKEFVIAQDKDRYLEKAFLWTPKSLPRPYKTGSVAFFLALQVAMLSAITLGAAIYYAGLALNYLLPLGAAIGGAFYLFIQLYIYRSLLK